MKTTLRAILCCTLLVSACDREREKTPEEMLDADIALATDLARANDALGEGEPDTLIGLTDDEPPPRVVAPPPYIESPVRDPGSPPPAGEPRSEGRAVTTPPAATNEVPPPAPRTRPAVSAAGCSSPAAADQRRCLLSLLARYDAELNSSYRGLIQRLRREAGVGAGEPDPASVEQLRVAQRSWLVYRDRECRRRTRSREGELWAPVRASCLGDLSDERARALRAM